MNGTLREILNDNVDDVEVGETQRHNHTDCSAGEDTRRRLYLTRKADVLLAYCHNCGQSASLYLAAHDRYRTMTQATVRKPAEVYSTPVLVGFDEKENIPAEAEAWRLRARLSRIDCGFYHIAYAPEWDAIHIPFFGMDGTPNGHQLRPLHRKGGAKYINFLKDNDVALGGILDQHSPILVIVEDVVSAIHVNRAGYSALVNYGTQVKPNILYNIPKDYNDVVVWLDNDNEVVVQHSKNMYDILHLYGRHRAVRRISAYEDPKHYDTQKIREIVDINGHS